MRAKRVTIDEITTDEGVAMLTGSLDPQLKDPVLFRGLAQRFGEWPLLLTWKENVPFYTISTDPSQTTGSVVHDPTALQSLVHIQVRLRRQTEYPSRYYS